MNETLVKLEILFRTVERFKNAYFFTPPTHAKERRKYESDNSVAEFTWDENGHTFTAEFTVDCSCRNVYAKGIYTRDGMKTTLTAVKNSYYRMKDGEKK